MAFYFALLNVSKKDNTQEKQSSSSHRRHRRHSIASVESPLLDYRLLPRPQLLSDDVVITNELAHQIESSSSSAQPNRLSDRRSRGSARASKWVQDNHNNSAQSRREHPTSHHPPLQREPQQRDQPSSSSRAQLNRADTESDPPPLSRSKRMAFGGDKDEGGPSRKEPERNEEKVKKRGGRAKIEERKRGERQSEEEEDTTKQMKTMTRPRGRGRKEPVSGEEGSGKEGENGKKSRTKPEGKLIGQVGQKKDEVSSSSNLQSNKYCSPPVNGRKPRMMKPEHPLRSSVFQVMAGSSATDESGRSSSQMSNESTTPRRDDSPASSCCDSKEQEVTMKLSGISMSSRSSEPRLKKVTFESSPYVISNSFLGDGAGKVLVVRRGSGTAVRRVGAMGNGWNQSRVLIEGRQEELSGDDWWTQYGKEEEQEAINDNHLNKCLEKGSGTRSILRCGLIRRRSTSDKSRLLAYRNSGFLSSSQERKAGSTSTSRMTVSVDRPKYK
ncbi:hypothetical protein CAEBREN_31105 [Caenorhabditis brenneri]|uniref:Uncharacterized protein n=1 Tax=Caenorhabditis brenneri TaxID=135651 RepID=G0PGZ0_CAEBE|nr:hypothetical protein CAEBREN_31105 [Caenorhabditis brenneri]